MLKKDVNEDINEIFPKRLTKQSKTNNNNNNNNGLLFIHTLSNLINSQRCEPCHLYELSQRPSH